MIRTRPTSALAVALVLASGFSYSASSQSAPPKPLNSTEAAATKPAQEPPPSAKACPDCAARRRDTDSQPTRTFYLKYAVQPADMNEIAGALRQLLQDARIMMVPEQAAVVIRAIPEDMALAERLLSDLDRPKKSWRLTYTVTEVDGVRRLGSQHYSMVVANGQQTTLKQGNRVPLTIATNNAGQNQVSYQDVGMSFDTTLVEIQGGARLRSDVTQSSLADDKAQPVATDPVLRQSTIRSEAILTPGKPLVLGSMDIPGSARHLEVEALIEPLP